MSPRPAVRVCECIVPRVGPFKEYRLVSLLYVVYLVAMVYAWLIVARAVLSWFRLRPGGLPARLSRVVSRLTEPYLRLFRRTIPAARIRSVGIDVSAMVGLIVLFIAIDMLVRL